MSLPISFRALFPAAAITFALLLQGCGSSVETAPVTIPVTPPAPVAVDPGKALSSYLHDLSPKLEGVTAADAVWEHYNIPVSDGTVLDGWIKRPPGEAGQPLVVVFSPYYGGGDPNFSLLGTPSDAFADFLIPRGYAVGFISVGGASTPQLASDKMREFVKRYTKMFGEYNDESNTKVYALEYILATIAANPAGMTDVEAFKATMDTFEAPNPYMKGDAKLKYVGTTSFGQKRQVSVPLVVNTFNNGAFETLFVAQVD